ncbi:hypothetical protein MBLNU230_g5208t1 [Neophaeotheca triangularis]
MVSSQPTKPWARAPPSNYLLKNANVVDVNAGEIITACHVTVSNGKILSVADSAPSNISSETITIDCQGKYVCPGLFDAHVHLMAVPGLGNLDSVWNAPNDVHLLRQPYVCTQMLHRGFTSVRDCGGAQLALKEAIEEGVINGPRLFIAGKALSQTGGHGDSKGRHDHSQCCGGTSLGLGRVCNGEPECMTAVRDQIRTGSDFIKIMASGGVASPTDKLEQLQFTPQEIQVMTQCADQAGTFVTAHAYTPKAIRHAINNGVKGIEHGSFVDAPTAELMAEKDVYLTPTMVTYDQMASPQWKDYLPPDGLAKNQQVVESGPQALKAASDAGVKMCFGTDLLGPLGAAQTREFRLRAQALSPKEILQSATINPAKMMGCQDSIGQIKPGFEADILLLDSNPLEDITILDDPTRFLLAVMKGGRICKSRWTELQEDGQIPVRIKPLL